MCRLVAPSQARDVPLTVAAVAPYAAACDIHGIDIYPVSTAGLHAGGPPVNTDISVVGDMTAMIAQRDGPEAIWTTLQIAWSGVVPPHPIVFPTLQQARFMAYDVIIAGARGLFFFGGQIQAVMSAADRQRGWNWTYWRRGTAPIAARADRRRPRTGPHRAGLGPHADGERRRHGRQRTRRWTLLLPARREAEPDRDRGGPNSTVYPPASAQAPSSLTPAATPPAR